MKNIQGKIENLELFNKNGKLIYKFFTDLNGNSSEFTYDEDDNILTFKDSNDYCSEFTYDVRGNELTYKNSNGTSRGFEITEFTME